MLDSVVEGPRSKLTLTGVEATEEIGLNIVLARDVLRQESLQMLLDPWKRELRFACHPKTLRASLAINVGHHHFVVCLTSCAPTDWRSCWK